MTTQHTKGPWVHQKTTLENRAIDRKWEIVSQETGGGCQVVVGSHTGIDCLNEANARLIAAAPELLEALQYLRQSAWERRTGNVKKDFDLLNACACADKAIRKATGSA